MNSSPAASPARWLLFKTLLIVKLLNYLIVVLFLGCGQHSVNKDKTNNTSAPSQNLGKKYFNYDTVIHYHSNFHDSSLVELDSKRSASVFDSIKRNVLIGQIPTDISDVVFVTKLEQMEFNRKSIDKSLFASIDSIFSEKPPGERITTACAQIYRDILIFKKTSNIVGVAKICFSCGDYQIVGTDANTENFYQNGAFYKLSRVLK